MNRPLRIVLVADDLTSAGDGAAPFQAVGFSAQIGLHEPTEDPSPGVTAVDLDTRIGSAKTAAARITRAMHQLADADILIKTMDSTARGHLEAEVRAALAASGRSTAIIAPAFPAEGRTTVDGIQLLAGVPMHETTFGRDPDHPVRDADLTQLIPGAVLAEGLPGQALRGHIGRERVVVADAASDADLDAIVAAVPHPGEVLWVGSPGLSEALARRLASSASPKPSSQDAASITPAHRSRVLTVVGSLHPTSQEQASQVGSLDPGTAVPVTDDSAVQRAEQQLADGGRALLHWPQGQPALGSVPAELAQAVLQLAARRAFDALVLTGGETARTVLTALGTQSIQLTGQPEPGIPLGILDRPWPIGVALKAGGFGDQHTLIRLSNLLAGSPLTRSNTCAR